MGAPGRPRVAVVVVTWNSATHLPDLFASLPAALDGVDAEVVVADNASSDGTEAAVRRLAPAATVVAVGRNAGYAAGLNAGIAAARSHDAYLALNPDVRLAAGAVRALVDTLAEPGTGVAVPRLREADGGTAPSLRREPTVLRALGEAVLGGRRAGRHAALGEVVRDPSAYERPGRVDWATGAVMLVSRACHERVGPWDESFFLYSEETDFALRARDAGFACLYCPSAEATHVGGDVHTSPRLYQLLATNRVRLYRRRHGPLRSAAFHAAVFGGEALRAAGGADTHRAAVRGLLPPLSAGGVR
jgi:GT2 family glycosyltransferase